MLESRQLASADLVNYTLDARVRKDISFDKGDALLRSDMVNKFISRVLVADYSQDIPPGAQRGLDGSDANVAGCAENEDCLHGDDGFQMLRCIYLCATL